MMKPGVKSMEHGVNGRFRWESGSLAVVSRQFSARKESGPSGSPTRHSPHATRHFGAAFSLIELLVVVTIIAVLAGLTLATLGYVNKKGAESRARAEVASLSAAIESFKIDQGTFPSNASTLYADLCSGEGGMQTYFQPSPGMVSTNGSVVVFTDPWGDRYEYVNYTNYFEIWSTAGGANSNNWIRN